MQNRKILLGITAFFICFSVIGQKRFYTKTGYVDFFSNTPLEDIKATNNQVAAYVVFPEGELNFAVLIKSFQFEKALMQEHFNENYLESDEFPRATFKGKILQADKIDPAKVADHTVNVEGELTIHGVTRFVKTDGKLSVRNDKKIIATAGFSVKPEDYEINIPDAVRNNIARDVLVTIDVTLEAFD